LLDKDPEGDLIGGGRLSGLYAEWECSALHGFDLYFDLPSFGFLGFGQSYFEGCRF
jgi:hypothetical protein